MFENIYTIQSPDKVWRAEISARLGANITKLQFNNEDVFVPLKTEEQYKTDPFVIGSPILLPANRTYKGEFYFQKRKYNLRVNDSLGVSNLHGFLYSVAFDVIDVSLSKIVLSYTNNGEIYPFNFKITVEYMMDNSGLKQSYCIENTGNTDMPFTFALHTTFIEPEKFCVPISLQQEKDKCHIPTGRYCELNEQENRYKSGSGSKDIIISGYYKSCGNSANIGDYTYTVSENFDHWVLYNGQGKSGFLCVEPQSGAVNGLNTEDGYKIIAPSNYEIFYTQITRNLKK